MAVAAASLMHSGTDDGLSRAAIYSGLLHLVLLVVSLFGLPQLMKPLPIEDRPMIVEALPLSSITNAPPSPAPPTPQIQQAQRPQPPEPPRQQPQVAPPPPAPAPTPQAQTPPPTPATPPPPTPPTPPQQTQATPIPPPPAPPQPAPPQPAAEALPAPVPAPPAPPPPPAPSVAAAPPQPTTPPPPPPQQAAQPQPRAQTPPTPQRQQPSFNLDNLLSDVRRQRPPPPAQPTNTPQPSPGNPRRSNAAYNPLLPLSSSEQDGIRRLIEENWNVDVGAKGIETFVVVVKVFVTADGTVQRAEIIERQGSPAEALAAFGAGAVRASLRAGKLPLPPDRAAQLTNGNLELRFSGREMLGMR